MSVLRCARGDCERIMCDRLSHTHGYICEDCFDELVVANPADIGSFMDSKVNTMKPKSDPYERFDREFPGD